METSIESYQRQNLIRVESGYELVPYWDDLTESGIKDAFKKLRAGFPNINQEFYAILASRATEKGFTDKRLMDAVNNLIDTFTYPNPTIANILSYQQNVKLYSYDQICEMVEKYGKSVWDNYGCVTVSGMNRKVWVSKIDIDRFNLESDNL